MNRASGVLMPIFSLPSSYGIGDFGKGAYEFVDFLKASGQKFWQILPLVQTGYGNSPYSSVSSTSFNPYFISVELLKKQKLLTEQELQTCLNQGTRVDYGFVYESRYALLRKAFARFDKTNKKFIEYVNSKQSLDYALFMTMRYAFNQTPFYTWNDEYKYRDKTALQEFEQAHQEDVLFWQFVQFEGQRQWFNLKKYSNKKGINIIGDLPLYVALDSVDVWVNPDLYKLNEDFTPKKVAGVPPDYFCEDGQLWGNPVYDYNNHIKDGFLWWQNRIANALKIYDYVRIDHFRGLDRYYEISSDAQNARVGEWIDVPEELFDSIHSAVDKTRIIAEDLGMIDDGVRELLQKVGYPGMKVLSFAFDGDPNNVYLPQNIEQNSICYTGTHDNDTLVGLISNVSQGEKANIENIVNNIINKMGLNITFTDDISLVKCIIEIGFNTKSKIFIIPMQDVLLQGSDFRINRPGVVSQENWNIRFNQNDFSKKTAKMLKAYCKSSKR